MKPREQAVLECIRRGVEYNQMMISTGMKKGMLWRTVADLLEQKQIVRIGKGQYVENRNGHSVVTPVTPIAPAPPVTPSPEPILEPKPADIESVATDLFEKIANLAPLLLLHKDMFKDIETSMLEFVERIAEIKPLLLTKEEMEEYRELKAMSETAKKITESKIKQR